MKRIIATLFCMSVLTFFGAATVSANSVQVSVRSLQETTATAKGYYLTILHPPAVTIDIDPTPDGVFSSAMQDVNVITNSPVGYQLYLSSDQETDYSTTRPGNALYKNGSPEAEYFFSPIADNDIVIDKLEKNTWGYSLGGTGMDIVEPTAYSPVPLRNSPTLIRQTHTAEERTDEANSRTNVYYGAKASMAISSGTFSGKVIYTAVTDADAIESASVSPSTTSNFSGGDTVRITTSLFGIIDDIDINTVSVTMRNTTTGSTINPLIADGNNDEEDALYTCTPTAIDTDDDVISVSCTLPAVPVLERTYDIIVSIPGYDKTYTAERALTYTYVNQMTTISTMQAMTTSICANTTTPAAFNEDGSINANVPQSTLSDIRDSKSYAVRKLADGNCWMVENLAYEINVANGTYVGSRNDGSTFNFTAKSCANQGECILNGNTTYSGQSGLWYYNWYAATAGVGTISTINTDINGSICPAHWRLPSIYAVDIKYSFGTMLNVYFGSPVQANVSGTILDGAPFSFRKGGVYGKNGLLSYGVSGFYTTSYVASNDGGVVQYTLSYNDTYYANTAGNATKRAGWAVRCVAL